MDNQEGTGSVNIRQPSDPSFYALGDHFTVWDVDVKGIQIAPEGKLDYRGAEEAVAVAADCYQMQDHSPFRTWGRIIKQQTESTCPDCPLLHE